MSQPCKEDEIATAKANGTYEEEKYEHPNCDHDCTSNCRREGCNCLCGEYHGSMSYGELNEALEDELRDTRMDTVTMLLKMYVQGEQARKLSARIVDALFAIDPVAVNELTEKN